MTNIAFLKEKLHQGQVILLDGATGTELEKRGVPMNSKAWSAEALLTHPEIVQSVHEEYIHAGVDVITANTFSTARHMLLPAGLTGQFRRLNLEAMQLAVRARERAATAPVAIAGSIAPTTFCSDASKCYPPLSEALSWYAEQAELLAESGADILIIEMIEDIEQGSLAVQAACGTGLPVWLGFSCKRSEAGEIMLWERRHTLATGIEAVSRIGGSAAFIMHTEVADTTEALAILHKNWRGTLGVYAHSGHFIQPNWNFIDIISPKVYGEEIGTWIKMGAEIVGGCCGIGPDHIREIKNRFCCTTPTP